jgi:D-alanyl-D-alanine carboxypeptidase
VLGQAAVGLLVVTTFIVVSQGASSSAAWSDDPRRGEPARNTAWIDGVVTEEDGALPAGVTVVDVGFPGVDNLDPGLLQALREAAADAAGDGIELEVNSGWRSRDYQDELLRRALSRYGSESEAARWVATPDTSPHVAGIAVDLGPSAAAAWLAEHGASYGLCRIYRNEPWHFELRARAVERGCPRLYVDASHDPRLAP